MTQNKYYKIIRDPCLNATANNTAWTHFIIKVYKLDPEILISSQD